GAGPEVLAHALDEVGAPVATGVHRAGGVRADDVDAATVVGGALCRDILEEAAGARDRAAGPDAGNEVSDLALGVGPDLGTGRLVVGGGSVEVEVLVGLPAAGRLGGEPVGHGVVGV